MQNSLFDLRMQYWDLSYQHWLTQELFSFGWFMNLAFIIVFYIAWVYIVDKQRLKELLLFGSFTAVVTSFIDIVGVTMVLWEYKIRLFPVSPAPFPFDYTIVPILLMVVAQYTSSWLNYIKGALLVSGVFSFVIHPIYVLLGIKQLHKANNFHLFILVFIVAIISKAAYNWVTSIQNNRSLIKSKQKT